MIEGVGCVPSTGGRRGIDLGFAAWKIVFLRQSAYFTALSQGSHAIFQLLQKHRSIRNSWRFFGHGNKVVSFLNVEIQHFNFIFQSDSFCHIEDS